MTTPVQIDNATDRQSLELDPKLTVSRILEIYLIAKDRNADADLDGLRKTGLRE